MRGKWFGNGFMGAAAMFLTLAPGFAKAYECPLHLNGAQIQIDRMDREIASMGGMMSAAETDYVEGLLGRARMALAEAQGIHDAAENDFDHTQAIIAGRTAHAHAQGAAAFSQRVMGH